MRQSKNKPFGKSKYYNTQRGKKEDGFFFVFPSMIISPKKFLHWDVEMFSVFLGWGRYYLQYNVFDTVRDTNTQVRKQDMLSLLQILKTDNWYLTQEDNSVKEALTFLNEHQHLILLLKNANLNHPYVKNIIINQLKEQPFLVKK